MAVGTTAALLLGGAMLGSSAIGAGASISAGNKAADAQANAAKEANAIQLHMFEQGRKDTAPWRIAGENALNKLIPMMENGPDEFVPGNDPGYKFGYSEFIENPTLKMASATGKLRSGATQKALTRYASDYASTKYDNHLSRYYDSLKPYQSMAGVGQTTASQGARDANTVGQTMGQNAISAGNARASGYINTGNAISNVAGGLGQNALDLYYMNKFKPAA